MALSISARGIPRPQPRPRIFRGRAVSTADPKARAWADAILRSAHGSVAPDGALAVSLLFHMPTPKRDRHGQPHTFRPDSDNLAKLALDALMRAKTIADDSKVSRLEIRKVWSAPEHAGVDILIDADGVASKDRPFCPPGWLASGGLVGH